MQEVLCDLVTAALLHDTLLHNMGHPVSTPRALFHESLLHKMQDAKQEDENVGKGRSRYETSEFPNTPEFPTESLTHRGEARTWEAALDASGMQLEAGPRDATEGHTPLAEAKKDLVSRDEVLLRRGDPTFEGRARFGSRRSPQTGQSDEASMERVMQGQDDSRYGNLLHSLPEEAGGDQDAGGRPGGDQDVPGSGAAGGEEGGGARGGRAGEIQRGLLRAARQALTRSGTPA